MNSRKKKKLSFAQKFVILVILASFFLVGFFIVIGFFNSPEERVKSALNDFTKHYYETQIYQKIADKNSKNETKNLLEEMKDTGFAIVHLRQLIYFNQENKDASDLVKKHCDEDKTYVKLYPEPPYEKNSYRADFTYSCEF